MKITYYGTGAALNPNVETTHFQIADGANTLQIDAGAGMNLAQKVLRKEIPYPKYIFMTHCHSDHLLGLAHLIRIINNQSITIIISHNLKEKARKMMYIIGKGEWYDKKISKGNIKFIIIDDLSPIILYNRILTPINLYSTKTEQFGFELKIKDKQIVFFGDEAINIMNRSDLSNYDGCDRLLCETFCTKQNAKEMQPYKKAHITAHDAASIGQYLKAKNLILSHIAEIYNLDRAIQCKEIREEALKVYNGNIFVPHDGEVIYLNNV